MKWNGDDSISTQMEKILELGITLSVARNESNRLYFKIVDAEL